MFYLWLLFLGAGFVKPAWRWLFRQRASSWPLVEGRINSVSVEEPKNFLGFSPTKRGQNRFRSEIVYSYSINGHDYDGHYLGEFGTEEDAQEFGGDLKDKAVMVQYNPNNPSTSALSETSLKELQQTRPPAPIHSIVDPARTIPQWTVPFLWLFAALSLAGLVLSLYVHISALLGGEIPFVTLGLHVGIFVVWFPAVMVAQRRVGAPQGKNFWKRALKGSPAWMLYVLYAFFGYAFINFFIVIFSTQPTGSGTHDSTVVWRGFSWHWMVFYYTAFAILYSAAISSTSGPRCMNGHALAAGETVCHECGQPSAPVE